MSTHEPDLTVCLTVAQRAMLIDGIDHDALERLLQTLPADLRSAVLTAFTKAEPGERGNAQIVAMIGVDDTLLADVWAPTWEAMGAEAIDRTAPHEFELPGREIARERLRRAAKPSSETP
jgi:hypothetical protein